MRIEVHIRVTCTVGRCASAMTIGPTTFEGWVDAQVSGTLNNVTLNSRVPPGWTTRTMEGSGELEPVCPACKEGL